MQLLFCWVVASRFFTKEQEGLDLHVIGQLSIVVNVFSMLMLISLSVDEILLPRYVNRSTYFRDLVLIVEIAHSSLKRMFSIFLNCEKRRISLGLLLFEVRIFKRL